MLCQVEVQKTIICNYCFYDYQNSITDIYEANNRNAFGG